MQISSQIITTNKPTSSFFTGQMPFLSPNQQCQSTEGQEKKSKWNYDNDMQQLWIIQFLNIKRRGKAPDKSPVIRSESPLECITIQTTIHFTAASVRKKEPKAAKHLRAVRV